MSVEHWICTACRSVNDHRSSRCYNCRAKRPKDAPVAIEAVRTVTDEWASVRLLEDRRKGVRGPSVMGALLFGLVAACFATAAWVSFEDGQVRRVFSAAWLVGFVVATVTVLGARGRTSLVVVAISGLLTIASVAIGEYLIVSSALAPPGRTGFIVGDPQEVLAALQEALPVAPLRPLLWVVAVFEGFAIPWSRLIGPVEGSER